MFVHPCCQLWSGSPRAKLMRFAGLEGATNVANYDQPEEMPSTSRTVGAIIVGSVLFVPGYLIAGVAVYLYIVISNFGIARAGGGESWIPFVAGFGQLLWFHIIPEGIRGAVGAFVALFVTLWFFKRADPDKVVFTVCGIWIAVGLLITGLLILVSGLNFDQLGLVANIVGIGVGGSAYRSNVGG